MGTPKGERMHLVNYGAFLSPSPRQQLAQEADHAYRQVVEAGSVRRSQSPRRLHITGLRILAAQFPLFGNWLGSIHTATGAADYRLTVTDTTSASEYSGVHATGGTCSDVRILNHDCRVQIEDDGALLEGRLDPDYGRIEGVLKSKNDPLADALPFHLVLEGAGGEEEQEQGFDATVCQELGTPPRKGRGSVGGAGGAESPRGLSSRVSVPRVQVPGTSTPPSAKRKKKKKKNKEPVVDYHDSAKKDKTPSASFVSSVTRFPVHHANQYEELMFTHPSAMSYRK